MDAAWVTYVIGCLRIVITRHALITFPHALSFANWLVVVKSLKIIETQRIRPATSQISVVAQYVAGERFALFTRMRVRGHVHERRISAEQEAFFKQHAES